MSRHPAASLLKLGTTAYGGPAIMGIMQVELQEKRQWVSKERFLKGLSLVNTLPGATAAQLSIFLGYARGGWWGGLLAGLCFVLPGFGVLLALTLGYAALGVTPIALGQFTPGPILMVAAYVGYKVGGIAGAVVGGAAAFLPSFVMMLAILPVFDRVRKLVWTRAALRGIAPAVIDVLGVSLVRMAPHALPDRFAIATLIATVIVLMVWRVATVKVMLLGAMLGLLRSRVSSLPGVKTALYAFTRV